MPTVLGTQVADGQMGSLAKRLAGVHLCILVLYVVGSILAFAQAFVAQSAAEESGAAGKAAPEAMVVTVVRAAANLVIPTLLLLGVRMAIKDNNVSLMQFVYIADLLGTCANGCLLVLLIVAFMALAAAKSLVSGSWCAENEVDCEDLRKAALSDYGIASAMMVLLIILQAVSCGVCLFAVMQSSKAHSALMRKEVFTGPPSEGVAGNVVGTAFNQMS